MKILIPLLSLIYVALPTFCQNLKEEIFFQQRNNHNLFDGSPALEILNQELLEIGEIFIQEGFNDEQKEKVPDNSIKKSLMNNDYQLDSIHWFAFDTSEMDWIWIPKVEYIYPRRQLSFPKIIYDYNSYGNLLSEQGYRWDSEAGALVGCWKYEYTYDEQGMRLSHAYYSWDSEASDWVKQSKSSYTYDASGNLLSYEYYNWDSRTRDWVGGDIKLERSYDSHGNLLSSSYYNWDAKACDWVGDRKYEYTYDVSGNLLSNLYYKWNLECVNWLKNKKLECSYNAFGYLLSVVKYVWNSESSVWSGSCKYVCTYNEGGNLISVIQDIWNLKSSAWEANSKYEYIYDAEGNGLSNAYFTWNSENCIWMGRSKNVYTYDGEGNVLSRIHFLGDSESEDWEGDFRYEYVYDVNGNQISFLKTIWDSKSNAWLEDWRSDCTYDGSGNLLTILKSVWYSEANEWIADFKYEYSYDLNGNQLSYNYYSYRDWDLGWKFEYSYDANGNQLSELQYCISGDSNCELGNNKVLLFYSKIGSSVIFNISQTSLVLEAEANSTATFFIDSNVEWSISCLESWISASKNSGKNSATITLTAEANPLTEVRTADLIISGTDVSDRYVTIKQSSSTLSTEKSFSGDFRVYPNPSSSFLNIETKNQDCYSLYIHSLSGQLVLSEELKGTRKQIDLTPFSPGIYFLTLRSNQFLGTKKVVKY